MRDRQAEWPAEKGDHGVPVGETAYGRGGCEGRNVAPRPVQGLIVSSDADQGRREDQQQCRRELDAAKIAGARQIARIDIAGQLLAHTSST